MLDRSFCAKLERGRLFVLNISLAFMTLKSLIKKKSFFPRLKVLLLLK